MSDISDDERDDELCLVDRTMKTAAGTRYNVSLCSHCLEHCGICFRDYREGNKYARREAEEVDLQNLAIKCARSDCKNAGKLVCGKCKLERYCSTECQKRCWSLHKKACNEMSLDEGTGAGRINIGIDEDEFVDIYRIGTRIACYHGNGETKGKIKSFNVGKGPFVDPLVRVDMNQYCKYGNQWFDKLMNDPCSCLPHYAIKCDDGSIELHEASEVHRDWMLVECTGTIKETLPTPTTADIQKYGCSKSTTPKFTLVSFMFKHSDCFYSQGLQNVLRADKKIDLIKAMDMNVSLLEEIGSSTCLVLFGVGSSGSSDLKRIYNEQMKIALTTFVKTGGVLIVQGEGCICKVLQDWFELPWKQSGYYRSITQLSVVKCTAVPSEMKRNLLPQSNSIKAVYMTSVQPENNLYFSEDDEDESAVAVAQFGEGRVAFVGDVNAEATTLEIIHQLGVAGTSTFK